MSNWPETESNDLDSHEIDPKLLFEATQFTAKNRTVPTGSYQIQGHPFDLEPDTRDPQKWFTAVPGRMIGNVRFDVLDPQGKKLASLFVTLSPEEYRNKFGGLDNACKLWFQAAKAFGVKTDGEVRENIGKYPLLGYINEQYRKQIEVDGKMKWKYVVAKDEPQRMQLISEGYEPAKLDLRTIKAVS